MKYINILIIVTFFYRCSSSVNTIRNIENNEVVFILFEKSAMTRKISNKPNISTEVTVNKKKPINMNSIGYYYSFKNKEGSNSDFYLMYGDYLDYDDLEKDVRKKIKFKANKSFLKKNKNQIITNKIISELGINKVQPILGFARTIFLIDKDEIKDGEILVRQVKYSYYSIE